MIPAYFKWENLNEKMGESWDYLVSQLEAHGHEYWTTAEDEPGYPIPDGLVRMGKMPRKEYESMVGHAKVLLGIGKPEISPSVYTAL
jgi:alpha-1,3(6)-mannosylglycoprotein beta-1,6-N-acetyl-glucosaminyltransferase